MIYSLNQSSDDISTESEVVEEVIIDGEGIYVTICPNGGLTTEKVSSWFGKVYT